jgi:hypothetical protein
VFISLMVFSYLTENYLKLPGPLFQAELGPQMGFRCGLGASILGKTTLQPRQKHPGPVVSFAWIPNTMVFLIKRSNIQEANLSADL